MKIAIEGCCHGQLDAIYDQISTLEDRNGYKVDLLLICGDFQAVRNWQDLQCMAVPNKYKALADFHKYYTREKEAPILTIIIGGNHEASNYMWELYHGGWVAPNIYFLGHAGCVQVNGIRIAGISGIFKGHDFRTGHFEKLPYDQSSIRSIYHVREYDIRRLSLLSSPDIFMSHDWPQSIEHHGDLPGLLRKKRFFEADIKSGNLGSPPLIGLLQTLQPKWWFAAHLHVRFEATYVHASSGSLGQEYPILAPNPDEIVIDDDGDVDDQAKSGSAPVPAPPESARAPANPDEILLDDEEAEVQAPPVETKFLALDKCLPRRQFLEVVDVETASPSSAPPTLSFDPEWLAVNRAFHPWLSTAKYQRPFPSEEDARAMVAKEMEWVNANIKKNGAGLVLVQDFQTFAPTAPGPGSEGSAKFRQPPPYVNPQTVAFCKMLGVEDKINSAPSQLST